MHNVLSDEKKDEPSTSTSTSASSPSGLTKRGAGKRVQLAKILAQPPSPPKEPEIIGEGLPLIQRLRLLKQKEDRERKQQEEREAMMQSLMPAPKPQSPPAAPEPAAAATAAPPPVPTPAPAPVKPVKRLAGAALLRSIVKTTAAVEAPPPASAPSKESTQPVTSAQKEPPKRESVSSVESGSLSSPPSSALVSRTLSPPLKSGALLIGEAAAIAASRATTEPISISAPPMPPKLSGQVSFSPPVSSGSMSPPVMDISTGRDRSASASSSFTRPPPRSAYIMMRPAALNFRQKTYGSVDDLSPEFSRLPFVKKLKILNERQKIAALLTSKTSSNILTRSTSEGSNENTTVTGSSSTEPQVEDTLHSVALGRRTQSNQEQLQGQSDEATEASAVPSSSSSRVTSKYDQSPPEREVTSDGSVGRGLSTMQAPSSRVATQLASTTSTSSSISVVHVSNTTKCLTKLVTDDASKTLSTTHSCTIPSRLSPTPTSLHVVGSGGGSSSKKRKKTKKMHAASSPTAEKKDDEGSSSSSSSSTPSPPELDSTETPERRNLKSILKRLAKSEDAGDAEGKVGGDVAMRMRDERKLMKAPTIEGYAARHRKFAKNVTFHRQAVTVVSPEDVVALASRTGTEISQTTESMQICRSEDKICDPDNDFSGGESGTGTQTEQLIPVGEHSCTPDVSTFKWHPLMRARFMHA